MVKSSYAGLFAAMLTALSVLMATKGDADSTQIIHIAHNDAPHNYNPAYANNVSTDFVLTNVFESLIRENRRTGYTPGLARKWDVHGNNTIYDFWIREGAKWSDGTPIDAAYVAESFQTFQELEETSSPFDFSEIAISILEDDTGEAFVRFELPRQSSRFFAYLSRVNSAVLPIHKADTLDLNSPWPELIEDLPASGPYMISGLDAEGAFMDLAPNPHFYDHASVKNDGIRLHFLHGNDRQAINRVGSGELDLAIVRPTGLNEYLNSNMQPFLRYYESADIEMLLLNTTAPPLDNPKIRKAIASIAEFDEESALIKSNDLNVTNSFLAGPILNSIGLAPRDASGKDIEEILANARAVMEAHGYSYANRLELRLAVNASTLHESMARLMRSRLSHLHIDAEIVVQPWSDHVVALQQGDFEIARYGWRYDIPHPSDLIDMFTKDSPANFTGFNNAAFEDIMTEIEAVSDLASLRELTIAAENLLFEQAPAIPLYQRPDALSLAHPDLVIGDQNFANIVRFEDLHMQQ